MASAPPATKLQARLRRGKVLGVLPLVDLQAGHAAVGVALEQRARQCRRATPELDDVLPGQRHEVGKQRRVSSSTTGHVSKSGLMRSFQSK